jgi:hypothetical protein
MSEVPAVFGTMLLKKATAALRSSVQKNNLRAAPTEPILDVLGHNRLS